MHQNSTIAITGAAGFIGSCLVGWLNDLGYNNLLIIDDFSVERKKDNFENKKFLEKINRSNLQDWLGKHHNEIQYFFHLGARTDTTETDYGLLEQLNLEYSKQVWNYCAKKGIPLIYASSAATYGNGEFGYKDDESLSAKLKPLNPYGISKNEFEVGS